jgi:broad specificity phosphatase PhoE
LPQPDQFPETIRDLGSTDPVPTGPERDEDSSRRTLILVKHAMPVVEPHTPPSSWRLSEEGRQQSLVLAERLEDYALERVITSEEPKAAETAKIVAERLGLAWSVAPGLHEHDRTDADFGTQNEFESVARTFFENPGSLVWGSETAEQASARFTSGVRAVLEEHPEGNLALVAHGTVITLFLTHHEDFDPHGFWCSLGLPSFCALSLPDFVLQDAVFDVGA